MQWSTSDWFQYDARPAYDSTSMSSHSDISLHISPMSLPLGVVTRCFLPRNNRRDDDFNDVTLVCISGWNGYDRQTGALVGLRCLSTSRRCRAFIFDIILSSVSSQSASSSRQGRGRSYEARAPRFNALPIARLANLRVTRGSDRNVFASSRTLTRRVANNANRKPSFSFLRT